MYSNRIFVFLMVTMFLFSGCESLLEEDFKSGNSTEDFYYSVDGLEALVVGAYVSSKIWYAKEEGYDFSDVGTDMYTYGQQHPNPEQFTFSPSFSSNSGRLIVVYVEFFKGVNACNEALFYLENSEHPLNEATRMRRAAEVRFLRAFYLWHLVETFGPLPLPLEHTRAPIVSATRHPVNEIYEQIFEDVTYAIDQLSPTDNTGSSEFGRVTRDAALAFRARLGLNVGSYIDSGNEFGFSGTSGEYYQQALEDANTVRAGYAPYDTYSDLWALENNSATQNSEGIWAINYSRSNYADMNVDPQLYQDYFQEGQKPWDGRTGGHHGHMMWGMRYEVFAGMIRDIQYGRRFRRYIPNKYLTDQFDPAVDARYAGQFMLQWYGNNEDPTAYPKWEDFELPGGFTPPAGEVYVFQPGDTSIVVTIEDIDDSRIAPAKDGSSRFIYVDGPYFILDIDLLYNEDGTINDYGTEGRVVYLELSKFDDPQRLSANGEGSERGVRDAYIFRWAEMMLIAAEADWKLNGGGYNQLLELAESRATDGFSGAQLLSTYGVNSNADLDMDFFLAERAREFPGEQLRWFDLKRVYNRADWVDRINQYNQDTREHLDVHHYLRPVPQVQIDALEDPSTFPQNNGY